LLSHVNSSAQLRSVLMLGATLSYSLADEHVLSARQVHSPSGRYSFWAQGAGVGASVGAAVGVVVGIASVVAMVGASVVAMVGASVEASVGVSVGASEGASVSASVGESVGAFVAKHDVVLLASVAKPSKQSQVY